MKKHNIILALTILIIAVTNYNASAQISGKPMAMPELNAPWTARELLAPATLAKRINTGNLNHAIILNIGAVEDIKSAKHVGAVSKPENLAALKHMAATWPKNTQLIIYCGCCPFAKCPNIRPAFTELKKMKFGNVKLLDLPTNLKTNWIAKGYPLAAR